MLMPAGLSFCPGRMKNEQKSLQEKIDKRKADFRAVQVPAGSLSL
jgi:hypothetical protein